MKQVATAKLILLIVSASYLLSAALLGIAKARGEKVTTAGIVGWAVTGALGLGLVPFLDHRDWKVSVAVGVTLAPWMAYALVSDCRAGHWIVAMIDAAGLGAIGFGIWLVASASSAT